MAGARKQRTLGRTLGLVAGPGLSMEADACLFCHSRSSPWFQVLGPVWVVTRSIDVDYKTWHKTEAEKGAPSERGDQYRGLRGMKQEVGVRASFVFLGKTSRLGMANEKACVCNSPHSLQPRLGG